MSLESDALSYWRSPSGSTAARPASDEQVRRAPAGGSASAVPAPPLKRVGRIAGDVAGGGDHGVLRRAAGVHAAAAGSMRTSARASLIGLRAATGRLLVMRVPPRADPRSPEAGRQAA